MKGPFMNKKTLMAGVVTGLLMTSVPSFAQTSTLGMVGMGVAQTAAGTALSTVSPYAGIALGAIGVLGSILKPPPYYVAAKVPMLPGVNIDAAQAAAEFMVLQAMKNVTDKWKPEPQEEYQKAAQSNGAGCSGSSSGGISYDSMLKTLPFQAAALKNVGIEAIGVGTLLSEIATTETREKIFEDLEWLQLKSSATSTTTEESDEIPGAGSCAAKYSVCSKYDSMTSEERDQVVTRQVQNEQNYGTAGIAHAELGLKSVQQAIANDGGSSVGKSGTAASAESAVFIPGKVTTVQNLAGMIGTGANTVAAMKIVAMMNLELAQRLNQGNMLQGSILTIEAARAIPEAARLTD